jgi:hypothetical protein
MSNTIGMSLARRDGALVALGVLVGAVALPWLPGPWLPASPVTAAALAFLLPATALSACLGQAVFAARARTDDEPSRASARAVATATTALCSFALGLHVLVLTTLVDAPFQFPAPARTALVLFGLHLAAIGNVLPRLRPGWPLDASARNSRHSAWRRTYRTAGSLCVVVGIAVALAGASLGGAQIDALAKAALGGAALCLGWSLRRVTTA